MNRYRPVSLKCFNPGLAWLRKWSLAGAFFLTAGSAQALTYYVDSRAGGGGNDAVSNPGTDINSPLAGSLTSITSRINTMPFVAGDRILFRRGSVWPGRLLVQRSGNSSAQIYYGSYLKPGDPESTLNPIINGGGNPQAIKVIDSSYVTIEGFELTNYPGTNPNTISDQVLRDGIRVTAKVGMKYGIKILNNDIHHVHGISERGKKYNENAGIYLHVIDAGGGQGGSNSGFDGVLIEDNYIHTIFCIGIYSKGADYFTPTHPNLAKNLVIKNNTLDGTGADLITVGGAKNPLVESNLGLNAGLKGQYYKSIAGMWSATYCVDSVFQFNEVGYTRNEQAYLDDGDGQAFDADLATFGTHLFQYNYSHDNVGGTILMMQEAQPKTVIYRYNLAVNDGRDTYGGNFGGSQFAVYPITGTNAFSAYNNTIYSTRQEGLKFTDEQAATYTNNIFYAAAGIYPKNPTFLSNCYWGHTPDVTDPRKLLVDPQLVGPLPAAGAVGDDMNVNTAPNFVPYRLKSVSPCINAGTAILGNGGKDYWQENLYAGTYADIGADEFTPLPGAAYTFPSPPPATTQVDDQSASVAYSGTWTSVTDDPFSYSGTRKNGVYSSTQTRSASYTFTGTNVAIFGKKGPGQGKLSVQIGSGTPVVVDCYWPVDLPRVELFQAGGLVSGTYTVTATLTLKNSLASANEINLDYFQTKAGASSVPTVVSTTTDDKVVAGSPVAYGGPSTNPLGSWDHQLTNAGDHLYYGATRSQSAAMGDYVTYTFTGKGVRLYGTKASSLGKLTMSLESPAGSNNWIALGTVNCFNTTKADLHVRLFEKTGLANGTYKLKATVTTPDPLASTGKVILDFFETL